MPMTIGSYNERALTREFVQGCEHYNGVKEHECELGHEEVDAFVFKGNEC